MLELELLKLFVHDASTQIFHGLVIPVAIFSIFFYLLGISGFFHKARSYKNKQMKKFPKITVQIPTFNEPVALRCAEACLQMDYPKNKYEILIGDDSSDPEVSKMIDAFARQYRGRIKVIRRGSNAGFKAGNLNNMLRYAKGEIIVVFDSDFVPPKDFLRRIIQPFADTQIACVQAKWAYMNMQQSPTSKFASTVLMVYHNLLAKLNNRAGVSLLFGSAEAVRKDVLVRLGSWLEGSVTEDVEFSVRALTQGYKTCYLPDLQVLGEVPYNVRGLRTQQRRWAYGNMSAFLRHKKSILFGKFSLLQRALLSATMLGYISSFFLVAFMFFGALSFMTGNPADINIPRLVSDVLINFILASGFTFAGIVALGKERRLHSVPIVFFSALTIGILVSLSVCHGIIKVLRSQPMHWTMIQKTGNENFSLPQLLPYASMKKS
ncbi:MAG: glycosyltransferase [Candidatus Aenigmarchaeota archaeon]|nr:glycosyltransferase [Candidatus Aenigmarchaeota archaeon]